MTNTVAQTLKSLVLLTAVLMIFSTTTRFAAAQGTTNSASSAVVPIGPSDPLNVNVAGEPDLTNTYIVDASGNIEVPYIGKVHVGGLTPDQSATLLQQKLSQIYTSPQVTVTRTSLGGISVTVIGSVDHQGSLQLRRDSHLNDAVQLASPTVDADINHITITSGLPGEKHVTVTYDLDSFLNGGNLTGNPALADGDNIYVPKSLQAAHSVSVTGEVTKPGRYNVSPGETVFDLITLAGGLTDTADPASTYVQAMGSTTQVPFNYNQAAQNPSNTELNPVLKDGDEVVVPEASSIPTFAITGAVIKPGEYPLKGVVSLLDAISNAGGLEDRALVKQTKITRNSTHGPIVITVDAGDTKAAATFYLQSGDNIIIPHGAPATPGVSPFEVLTGVASIIDLFRL